MAPFTPFLSEALWQSLTPPGAASVHQAEYPAADPALLDPDLERRMAQLRRYASAGRAARQKALTGLPLHQMELNGEALTVSMRKA